MHTSFCKLLSTQLKDYDSTTDRKVPKHKTPSSKNNEFETPSNVFYDIVDMINQLHFVKMSKQIYLELDPFTTNDRGDGKSNSKCKYSFTIDDDVFNREWYVKGHGIVDVWVNHPHQPNGTHKQVIQKIDEQYRKWNMNVVMILPSNCRRTSYWHEYIEPHIFRDLPHPTKSRFIYNFPYDKSIRFNERGKPSEDFSRNAYEIVFWVKQ